MALLCPVSFAAESDLLGEINFPTSANGAAQEHFLAGVAYLHSFGFTQARAEFLRAQELDPGFALGYWGESLTYNHPLYAESDLLAPAQSLEKLAATRQQREASAASGIERGFMTAAEAFAFTQGTVHERRRAYRSAMEELYGNYPASQEVQAFYTLALISEAASASHEQRAQLRELAGLLATRLFEQNPRHPGAIHYVMHSYDDAASAESALVAADLYAEIAPLVSHARHMPSHIYGHLGRWYQVAEVNETAFYTARALWRPGDDPHDQIHALDFGLYGDLQLADFEAAERWIERAEDTLAQNPDHQPTRELLARMHARLMVESKHWAYQPINSTRTDDELFAYGLSAVNMRDLALARRANTLMKERASREPENLNRQIAQLELEASILFASGQTDESWTALDRAIELALKTPNIDPLPEPMKPPLELKGELLLRDGKVEQAIDAFRESLNITAQRPWSLLGLARSYAAAGLNESASSYYQQLLNHWTDSKLLGVSEARTHLSVYGSITD
jgi:hypothetical protein